MDEAVVEALVATHGFPREAVTCAIDAARQGNFSQAQFNHPALGGMGQWMPGMVMIGDIFNGLLQSRVSSLFADIARRRDSLAAAQQSSLPLAYGSPSQTSRQNNFVVAYFPNVQRLVAGYEPTLRAYALGGRIVTGIQVQNDHVVVNTSQGSFDLSSFQEVPLGA